MCTMNYDALAEGRDHVAACFAFYEKNAQFLDNMYEQ